MSADYLGFLETLGSTGMSGSPEYQKLMNELLAASHKNHKMGVRSRALTHVKHFDQINI